MDEACVYNSDCKDVVTADVCVNNVCQTFGHACDTDAHCRVICRDQMCTFPTVEPEASEIELNEMILNMLKQLGTPSGVAMLATDELVEGVSKKVFLKMKSGVKLAAKLIRRTLARKAGQMSSTRLAPIVTRSLARTAVKNISASLMRKGVTSSVSKMASVGSTGVGMLLVALQVIGMVLDVDDSAGFSTQLSQGNVDLWMKKMLQYINEDETLREVGIQFPYEYLPEATLEWRAGMAGDVASDQQYDLMLNYISKLDVNSNGKTIIRAWDSPDGKTTTTPDPTLWALAGKSKESYSFLSKWWWLMLVLVLVVTITIGIGVGLSARKRSRR
jgi:hypothetical protein